MAKNDSKGEKVVDQAAVAMAQDNPVAAFADMGEDDGFETLNLSAAMYSPNVSKRPIQGYPIKVETKTSKKLGQTFDVVHIRLTRATEASDGDKKPYVVEAGNDIMLVLTATLKGLVQYATMPDKVAEVKIAPTDKRPIGGGQTMWEYDTKIQRKEKWQLRADIAPETIGNMGSTEFAFGAQSQLPANGAGPAAALPQSAS